MQQKTKFLNFRTNSFPLLLFAFLARIVCFAEDRAVVLPVVDELSPLPAGGAKITGHVGGEIDAVVRARYSSDFAQKEVYPETAEALRQRIDDRMPGGRRPGYWQGEFWGKWMLGAVAAERYTGDARLREFIRSACREAIATQDKNGYIGTYSKTDATNAWNIWGMKYTLWALVEAHEILGDADLLAAARREMDYLMTFVGPGKADIVNTGECAGYPSSSILQPLLFLYRGTGDKRYLDYAEYIVGRWNANSNQPPGILRKALAGEKIHDWFPHPEHWAKAYEFTHCVEGLAELYRATGNTDYLRAAENVAADLIANERTLIGDISLNDRINHAKLQPEACSEVCDAVYYTRLCTQLLRLTGKVVYANELERTFYNSLCAAENADGSWVADRLSLKAAHVNAPMHCLMNHQHCCVANAPRGLLQAAQHAVMTGKDGVVFNLYLPGDFAATLPDGGKVELAVGTDYPATGKIDIAVNPAAEKKFAVILRIPAWSASSTVKVNGKPLDGVKMGEYFPIRRKWKSGDLITLELDMRGRVITFPDATQAFVAVERGPLVLARDSLLGNGGVDSAVALAADKEGFIPLEPVRAPKGIWLAFDAPLASGGSIPLCDYSSVGEIYKHQIPDLFSSPARPGMRSTPPKAGIVPEGMEDFRVWLPVEKNHANIRK